MYTFDNFKRPLDAAIIVGNQHRPSTKSATLTVDNVQYIISSSTLHDSTDGLMRSVASSELKQDTVMYVINYANNGGFAIVSTDYRTEPVIALSQSGSFDVNNMPPNVEFVIGLATDKHHYDVEQFEQRRDSIPSQEMAQLREQYSHYQLYTSSVSASKGGEGGGEGGWGGYPEGGDPNEDMPAPPDNIGGSHTTADYLDFPQKYDQGYPFNDIAPMIGGSKAVAGCVAIAVSQIMVYYKYPAYVAGLLMPWSGMAINSNYYNQPLQTKNAISIFVRNVGDRVDNNWGLSATSATNAGAKTAFQFYGYNSAGPNNYSDLSVQQSIRDKRPVYMSGQDEARNTAHAWVVEGVYYYSSWGWDWIWNRYTKEYELGNYSSIGRTMYRCNWGWGGYKDGVFLISNLTPGTGVNYSKNVKVLTNIRIN